MPACGHDVAVAPSETTACVNHEKASEQLTSDVDDVMFLSDCAEVDVALVQAEKHSSKPDVKKDLESVDVISAPQVSHVDVQHHTEPWLNQHFISLPDIILTTQRFRL
jgi:hypothetical protein